jgi:hypothetical protein
MVACKGRQAGMQAGSKWAGRQMGKQADGGGHNTSISTKNMRKRQLHPS